MKVAIIILLLIVIIGNGLAHEWDYAFIITGNDSNDIRKDNYIHHPDGTTSKQWLPDQGDNKINMKAAEQFLRNHWKEQRKRYEDELHGN